MEAERTTDAAAEAVETMAGLLKENSALEAQVRHTVTLWTCVLTVIYLFIHIPDLGSLALPPLRLRVSGQGVWAAIPAWLDG